MQAGRLTLVEENAYLSKGSKNYMLKYLRRSFSLLGNDKKVKQAFAKGGGWAP